MPRRRTGWVPALTHLRDRQMGRVRLPGRPDVYFGPAGVWPAQQRTPPASVAREYKRVIAEWLASGGEPAPPPVDTTNFSVCELVDAYKRHIEQTYRKRGKPTSLLSSVRSACRPLLRLYGDLPAARFGAGELRALRNELLRDGTRSKATVLQYAGHVRTMFAWGEQEGLVPEAVVAVLRGTRLFGRGHTARVTPGRKRPVAIEDVERTLPELPPAPRAMVQLQLLTGMRPEEVCYARAGDFTEDDGLLRYEAREDANKLAHLGVPKIVYLGPRAREIIRPFLDEARQHGPDAWVFTTRQVWNGAVRCYTPTYYRRVVGEACARAGVPHYSPGRLRHTRLSQTRKRYTKDGAQAEAGHLHPEMTGRYTDSVLDELARKIARETG